MYWSLYKPKKKTPCEKGYKECLDKCDADYSEQVRKNPYADILWGQCVDFCQAKYRNCLDLYSDRG